MIVKQNKLRSRNKKSIEKIHIEYFKERCKDLPLRVDDGDYGENPDFLWKHSLGVLGIEHTQLFKITKHPNAPQALESFRQQIVESAKECCNDIPPLCVRVWFIFNQRVPKNRAVEIKRISRSLAAIVKKWHRNNPKKHYEILKSPSQIPSLFLSVSIARSRYHWWIVDSAACQLDFPTKEIQDRINKKNRRYKEYLKKCDECWLLIIVDIFRDSQSFEIPNQIDHRFESKFERIYYMDASHRKDLRELPITRI